MGWHRTTGTTARKAWEVGHAIPSSSINRATEPASKRRPEYPVTPIRPAPWRRFLSRTAIDSVCPLPRCPSPLRKPKNKIAAQIATFLRLGIVAWPPIADRSAKAQEISRNNEPFPLFGDRKESLIEKKLQRSQDFCFLTRKIAATGRSGRWRAGRMVAGGTDERGETRNGMRNGRNDLRCARRTERECDDEISLFCTLGQIKPDFLAR